MGAKKIKRLEAGRIEREPAPPEAESKTWAKAGASPKPAASLGLRQPLRLRRLPALIARLRRGAQPETEAR